MCVYGVRLYALTALRVFHLSERRPSSYHSGIYYSFV